MAETSAAPQIPPVDPKQLIDTAVAVLRNPTEFFKSIKGETGFQKPVMFAVAAGIVFGVLAGVGAFLWSLLSGQFLGAIMSLVALVVAGPIIGLVDAFVGAFIVWGLSLAFGSKAASWEPSVPIASYALAVMPAFAVQFLLPGVLGRVLGGLIGLAAGIYLIYICVMGAKVINFDAPPTPAAPPQA